MDPMFDCRTCGGKAKRLIYLPGGESGCNLCVDAIDNGPTGLLHHTHPNKHYKGRMTQADRLHIVTRERGWDGSVRPAPRWR